MNKQIHIIMTIEDEQQFSDSLAAAFPGTVFLDGNVWPTPEPVTRSTITQCTGVHGLVYIWNRNLFPSIPVKPRPAGGGFQGPARRSVIQFVRSRNRETVLRGGGADAGFEDPVPSEVKTFFNAVWRILKKNATNRLMCVEPETCEVINPRVTDLWAWPGAIRWCLSNDSHLFQDNGNNYYRPAQSLEQFQTAFGV